MMHRRAALAGIAIATLASCRSGEAIAPPASVYFLLDAPLCSSRLPVQFSIDSVLVGTDTFAVNLANAHTRSRAFDTPAGPHTLGARVVNGYVWADRKVTLAPGDAFTDTLPFYCS